MRERALDCVRRIGARVVTGITGCRKPDVLFYFKRYFDRFIYDAKLPRVFAVMRVVTRRANDSLFVIFPCARIRRIGEERHKAVAGMTAHALLFAPTHRGIESSRARVRVAGVLEFFALVVDVARIVTHIARAFILTRRHDGQALVHMVGGGPMTLFAAHIRHRFDCGGHRVPITFAAFACRVDLFIGWELPLGLNGGIFETI
ncbi:MAG: hypothetical protein HDKAJFGB_02587 [Anaerolineae bacterium]|nr:hypothetical protein [Anaerolineae bacterium]